jgi:hypothetical protein
LLAFRQRAKIGVDILTIRLAGRVGLIIFDMSVIFVEQKNARGVCLITVRFLDITWSDT